jgi:hypothetical protein
MCYDANNGYICVVDNNVIHRININSNGQLSNSSNVTIAFADYLSCIAWYDGLYYAKKYAHIYVTPDLINIIREFDVEEKENISGYRQGMDVDENYLYVCDSGGDVGIESVCVHDKINGKLLKTLYYPTGTFGEIEEVAVYNGYFFININRPANDTMLGVYKVPIYKKTIVESKAAMKLSQYATAKKIQTLYVDNSNTIVIDAQGTQDNPFNSLALAIKLNSFVPYTKIYVNGTYTTDIEISGCPDITFDVTNATFGLIWMRDCGCITFVKDGGSGTIKTIQAEHVHLILHNVVMNGNLDTPAPFGKCIASTVTGSASVIGYTSNGICSGDCYYSNIFLENNNAENTNKWSEWGQDASARTQKTISIRPTNAAGTWKISCDTAFAAIVTFSSTTSRNSNRVFFVNGYGAGGTTRTKYYRVPTDDNDGSFTVTVAANENAVLFEKTDSTNVVKATVNGIANSATVAKVARLRGKSVKELLEK